MPRTISDFLAPEIERGINVGDTGFAGPLQFDAATPAGNSTLKTKGGATLSKPKTTVKKSSPKSAENTKAYVDAAKSGAVSQEQNLTQNLLNSARGAIASKDKLIAAKENASRIEGLMDKVAMQLSDEELMSLPGQTILKTLFPQQPDVRVTAAKIRQRRAVMSQLAELPIGTQLSPENIAQIQAAGISDPGKYMSLKSNSFGPEDLVKGAVGLFSKIPGAVADVARGAAALPGQFNDKVNARPGGWAGFAQDVAMSVGRSKAGGAMNPFAGAAAAYDKKQEQTAEQMKLENERYKAALSAFTNAKGDETKAKTELVKNFEQKSVEAAFAGGNFDATKLVPRPGGALGSGGSGSGNPNEHKDESAQVSIMKNISDQLLKTDSPAYVALSTAAQARSIMSGNPSSLKVPGIVSDAGKSQVVAPNIVTVGSDGKEKNVFEGKGERKEISAQGIKDLGLIYLYVKILDPTSAVREGEIKLSQEALGALGKAGVKLNNIFNGSLLDDRVRKGILAQIQQKEANAAPEYISNYLRAASQVKTGKVDKRGVLTPQSDAMFVNLTNLFPEANRFDSPKDAAYYNLPRGSRFMDNAGNAYTVIQNEGDIKKLGIKKGQRVMLPDGRVAVNE